MNSLHTRLLTYITLTIACLQTLPAQEENAKNPQRIILPTENDFLFRGESSKFYMYVYRSFEGVSSKPWTAGKYGFVRNLRRTEDGVIGTRFHEGIDIKPLQRDQRNNPLDPIKAIAAGTVAYTCTQSSRSNYGKYVVIEHTWQCGPIFTLYAHLSKVDVKTGEKVTQGQTIGRMGYTGSGLNKERAHLHLELNLMLNEQFPQWHNKHLGGKNYHGIHNGMNLVGLDIGSLYLAQQRNPSLTIPEFIRKQPVHYKITLPRDPSGNKPAILKHYPWLQRGNGASPSWEISFTASGLPISIIPSQRSVSAPRVSSIRKCQSKHSYHTKGYINGTGYRASLSEQGLRYLELVTDHFSSADTPEP